MNQYTLTRTKSGPDGTFGAITDEDDTQLCVTGEPAPTGPHPCIPAGTYHCIPHNSPAHPNTWELENVPGRTAILIHSGNAPKEDSLGCILIGDRLGIVDDLPAVLDSNTTLKSLRALLPLEFDLTITESLVN